MFAHHPLQITKRVQMRVYSEAIPSHAHHLVMINTMEHVRKQTIGFEQGKDPQASALLFRIWYKNPPNRPCFVPTTSFLAAKVKCHPAAKHQTYRRMGPQRIHPKPCSHRIKCRCHVLRGAHRLRGLLHRLHDTAGSRRHQNVQIQILTSYRTG